MTPRRLGSAWPIGIRPSHARSGSARKELSIVAAVFLGVVTLSGEFQAAPLPWQGTLGVQLYRTTLPRPEPDAVGSLSGSGVGTLLGAGAGSHLGSVRLDGGITGTVSAPVTDPDVTQASGILKVIVTAEMGAGTLDTSGPGVLPVRGMLKTCLYDPNCAPGSFFLTPMVGHGVQSNTVGFGIGGAFTTRLALSHPGPGAGLARTSILGAPWTIAAVTLGPTALGGTMTLSGFAHGPASLTSSTAAPGGMVQMVTSTRVESDGSEGNFLFEYFGILTVRVVPEPGVAVLLGAGIAGLLLVARRRRR